MQKKRFILSTLILVTLVFVLSSFSVFAASTVLKKDMSGTSVTSLQKDLIKLGYLTTDATGYFGDLTEKAVKSLQSEYKYDADGVVGATTFSLIERLKGKSTEISNETSYTVLKQGMNNSDVVALQKSLIKLGYLFTEATGLYGDATKAAVKKVQSQNGFDADGIAGTKTLMLIDNLINKSVAKATTTSIPTTTSSTDIEKVVETTDSKQTNFMLPWFDTVATKFALGDIATIYDIETGISFKIKRTYGHNHADCETLTSSDTAIMKRIFGGEWTWSRRAIIVSVNGLKIAASMAGMPHAGNDEYAANQLISSRSGGYSRGENLDAVKDNNMNGVFDVHFYGSKTHATNKVDPLHQEMINKANKWAKANL